MTAPKSRTRARTPSSSRAGRPAPRCSPGRRRARKPRQVELTIDGHAGHGRRRHPRSSQACRAQGIDIPTLCHGETVEPEGVCRLCVVDTGGRALTPSCSAKVSQGMDVSRPRTRRSAIRGSCVLELLGSSVDVDLAGPALPDGSIAGYMARYEADPSRFGPPAPPAAAGERDTRDAGHHHAPDGSRGGDRRPAREGGQQPLRAGLRALHPLLQVRRGVRRGRPELVRDLGRRARVRRPDLDRVRHPARRGAPASSAATASTSVRRAR